MKKTWKAGVVAAGVAILLAGYFGAPAYSAQVDPGSINFFPTEYLAGQRYTIADIKVNTSIAPVHATSFAFQNTFTAAATVNQFITTEANLFSDLNIKGSVISESAIDFNPGSKVIIGGGYVAPTPHPRHDGLALISEVNGFDIYDSWIGGGYVAPTPHPRRDGSLATDYWNMNAIFSKGSIDLTDVTIQLDDVSALSSMKAGDRLYLFGSIGGLIGTPTLSGAAASMFRYVDPPETGYLERVVTPEPSTLLLVAGGLAGLAGIGMRRRNRQDSN